MTERLLHATTSLCKVCKEATPASVVALGQEVWMKKTCADHGAQDVRISTSVDWYERTRATKQVFSSPKVFKNPVDLGCPFDCGPCTSHTQKVRLPVVTITSACNLDCPICYVHNKNDDAYHMPLADFALVLEQFGEFLVGDEPHLEQDTAQSGLVGVRDPHRCCGQFGLRAGRCADSSEGSPSLGKPQKLNECWRA